MARRFRRRSSGGARKRVLLWVNIPFTITFTKTAGGGVLLTPEDWEAQFTGDGNERCTLLAIRGCAAWSQTVVGTNGVPVYWGIFVQDKNAATVPTWTVAGMADVDWLFTDCHGTQATAVSTTSAGDTIRGRELEIKARRRMSSRDSIWIAGQHSPTDVLAPATNLYGIARFLISRS